MKWCIFQGRLELYIGLQREKSLHVIINFFIRARTKLKGGGFLVTPLEVFREFIILLYMGVLVT